MRILLTTVLLISILGSFGCSNKKDDDPTAGWSASRIYTTAKDYLDSGNYEDAVKYFEALEARYPFGRFAEQAQLEIAYAYYKFDEPDLAIAAADRFIRLHPRNKNVPYAYYIKGLANFNRGHGIMDKLLSRDYSENDAQPLIQSYQDFATIVRRYPNSRYAQDARDHLAYLRNLLARHELHVANYYMKRKAFLAAAKRAEYIIEHFQGSDTIPDSLVIQYQAYKELGLNDLSQDSLRVLKLNFPEKAKKLEKENKS
jgi:outer membrane protein assembly factor BamD